MTSCLRFRRVFVAKEDDWGQLPQQLRNLSKKEGDYAKAKSFGTQAVLHPQDCHDPKACEFEEEAEG